MLLSLELTIQFSEDRGREQSTTTTTGHNDVSTTLFYTYVLRGAASETVMLLDLMDFSK